MFGDAPCECALTVAPCKALCPMLRGCSLLAASPHVVPSRSCTPCCVVSCPLAQTHVVQCLSPRDSRHWQRRFRRQIRSAALTHRSLLHRFCRPEFPAQVTQGFGSAGFAGRDSLERFCRQEFLSATLFVCESYAVYTWCWVRFVTHLLTWQVKLTSGSRLAVLVSPPNTICLSSVSLLGCHNLSPDLGITEQL